MEYTKTRIDQEILEYFHNESLMQYITCTKDSDYKYRYHAGFEVNPNLDVEFPPDITDLVRMHRLVRQRKCLTIMEFGVGYSTLILADAMMKNELDFHPTKDPFRDTHTHTQQIDSKDLVWSNQFEVHSIDSSKKWIKNFKRKLKKFPHIQKFVHLHYSELKIVTMLGQIGHIYTHLPDIVPDFIYLDGPCPADVQGTIRGQSFKQQNRTVMAMDIINLEACLSPGTFILVDGRSNNARFLKNHFKRQWTYYNAMAENWETLPPLINFEDWNDYDYTTFELIEFPLNYWNLRKLQLCLGNIDAYVKLNEEVQEFPIE